MSERINNLLSFFDDPEMSEDLRKPEKFSYGDSKYFATVTAFYYLVDLSELTWLIERVNKFGFNILIQAGMGEGLEMIRVEIFFCKKKKEG